ncbi:MAG: hypothetical protein ACOYVJ_01940 [Nitrospirota bacterium]
MASQKQHYFGKHSGATLEKLIADASVTALLTESGNKQINSLLHA